MLECEVHGCSANAVWEVTLPCGCVRCICAVCEALVLLSDHRSRMTGVDRYSCPLCLSVVALDLDRVRTYGLALL